MPKTAPMPPPAKAPSAPPKSFPDHFILQYYQSPVIGRNGSEHVWKQAPLAE